MKSSTKSDKIFLFLLAVLFFTSATLLAKDILFSSVVRQGENIGTIIFRNRYAEQKAPGSALWASVRQHSPVYNLDTIRTGAESTALIKLHNGTEIFLSEESMIFLSLSGKKTAVGLSSGSARVNSVISQEAVTLTNGKNEVVLQGGSSALLQTDGSKNVAASFSVTTDSPASVQSRKGDVIVSEEIPIFPLNGQTIVATGSTVPIQFSWHDSTPVRLLVSQDPSFKKPIVNTIITGGSYETKLTDGVYYWKQGQSAVSWFTALTGTTPKALSPDNTQYRLTGESLSIVLRWSHASIDSLYRLTVVTHENPNETVYDAVISQRTTQFEVNNPGNYMWTVTALSGPERKEYKSSAAFFTVKKDSLQSPLFTNSQDALITVPSGRQSLSWQPEPGAHRYEIDIFTTDNKEIPIKSYSTTQNSISLSELSAGNYTVVARSISSEGQSQWSEGIALKISNPVPPTLIKPAKNESVSAAIHRQGYVSFKWEDENLASNYILTVSALEDMSSPLFIQKSKKNYISITDFSTEKATLFWNVSAFSTEGTLLAVSETRPFFINKILDDPIPLSPVNGKKFDLLNLSKLHFTWKKSPNAYAYRITIYRMTALIPALVGEWTTTNTELFITQFERFSLDHFAWDIQALYTDSSGTVEISPGVRSFFRIDQNKPLAVPSIRQMSTRGKL